MRSINKLSDTRIEKVLRTAAKAAQNGEGKVIMLGDGGGLTLQIAKTGQAAAWLYRYFSLGKATAVGLGPYPDVSLKMARERAEVCRQLRAAGKDPLAEKKGDTSGKVLIGDTKERTFRMCATEYIEDHAAEWKNAKHCQQWTNTLTTYAFPIIGEKEISAVTTADLKRILSPIWTTKHETATRVRGRIEAIIDWATVQEFRTGDNPARWKGHLAHLLAKSVNAKGRESHHAALPYAEIPKFMSDLARQEGMSRWALELLILTASRTSEIALAEWSEFDFRRQLWTIPGSRMKAGKEHRIPLTPRAIEILRFVEKLRLGRYVFPAGNQDKPLSNMAMAMLIRRMKYTGITVHGFRSTFRDFIAAETHHDFHTAEAALAHGLKDKVAAAYARTDLFEKRYPMMLEWSQYCSGERQIGPPDSELKGARRAPRSST